MYYQDLLSFAAIAKKMDVAESTVRYYFNNMSLFFGSGYPINSQYKIVIEGISLDFDSEEHRLLKSTVSCSCGNRDLNINFISPPCGSGGYIKVTCPKCNASDILLDNYS